MRRVATDVRILSYNIRRGGVGREVALASVIRAVDLTLLCWKKRPARRGRSAWRWTQPGGHGRRGGKSLAFMSRDAVASFAAHRPPISRHAFLEMIPATTNWRVFAVHLERSARSVD